MIHSATNGRIAQPREAAPEPVHPPASSPPLAFQVAYLSLAVFAGPSLFALVVGVIFLMARLSGMVFAVFQNGAGS